MSTRVIQKIIQFIHLVLHRGFGSFTSNPCIFKINNIVPRCSGTFIKKNRNIRVLGITASLALSILTIATIFPITKQSDTAEATYVPATTTLSIVSSKDTASVDITPTSASGTFATSAAADMAEFTVTTDNLTGYSVTLLGSDASGQLVNDTTGDTLDSIIADTTENDFRTGSASTYNNKWGYRLNINNTTTTNFLSAPTSTTVAKTIYSTTRPNTTSTSDSFTLGLGARIDYTKPTGTYTNTFIITAIANNISYQINYLDSDTTTTLLPSDAESNISASSIELNSTTPTKSGYEFKGWCDGTLSSDGTSCTGTPGTTYQPGDTYTFTTLSSTTSNIANLYAMWEDTSPTMQDFTPAQCSTLASSGNYTLKDVRDNNTYTVRYINGECWMTQNLAFQGTTLNPSDSDVTETRMMTYENALSTTGECDGDNAGSGASYTNACLYYKASDSYNGNRPNAWYNYKAVTAGTISGSSNSTDPTESVCPRGWKLPTNAQFSALLSYTGSTGTIFNPVYGGHINDHDLKLPASSAGYWSSTANGAYLRQIGWYVSGSIAMNSGGYRAAGYNVRCVLQPTMQNFTTQEAESMATGESRTLVDSRDGKSYTVAKLADGQIWMTSDLNLAGGTALYSDDSDVDPANTRASGTPYYTLPSSSSSGFSSDTVAYVYNTGNETTSQANCTSTQPCNSYYSWLAATAGGKDASGTAVTGNGPDAAYSICPKGWRLPKSGNQSDTSATSTTGYKKGDFYKLATAYGANLESSYYQNTTAFNTNAGPGTLPNFLLAGNYYSSSFDYGGTHGLYWSSSSYSSTVAYDLYFSSSYVNSAGNYYRRRGFSVRCVFAGAQAYSPKAFYPPQFCLPPQCYLWYNHNMRILDFPISKSDLIKNSTNFIDENAIKAVVDIKKEIMAVDSPMHYDCEQLLLENGSSQEDLWGINLYLDSDNIDDMVEFDSMINIRPAQNNRTRSVEDENIQEKIKSVVAKWLK